MLIGTSGIVQICDAVTLFLSENQGDTGDGRENY